MNGKMLDFTMGADPEFLCIGEGGNVVFADDHFNESNGDYDEELSADGGGVAFEIRPKPSVEPLKIINNIRNVLLKQCLMDNKFMNYKWMADSYYKDYSCGGHIHFGTKKRIDPLTASGILDNYTGLVSILLETKQEGFGRRQYGGYGGPSDYRKQLHGFEYRTPSSWISSPYLASSILCLSKVVMFDMLNNPNFKCLEVIERQDILNMDVEKIRGNFSKIYNHVKTMILYPKYKSYIDLIDYMITNKLTWHPNVSMQEAWGICDLTGYKAKKVSLNSIWANYKKISKT